MKSGFNEAPPTRKPSTSGCLANSSQLPAKQYTSINYTRRLSNLFRDFFLEIITNPFMHFFSLLRARSLACSNGPNRLIRDSNLFPVNIWNFKQSI
uniref:Uncharacterized protein n=1 Tax=Meloidogyne incognita TaxID=6306 RepID=A0A914LZZ0_MELIC